MKRIFSDDFNMKEMLTNSDVTNLAGLIINRYLMDMPEEPKYDMNWAQIFRTVSTNQQFERFPQKSKLTFTWEQGADGKEPKIAKVTNKNTLIVQMAKWRTMAEFDNDMLKYNQVLRFEETLRQLSESGWEKLAELHYDLIDSSSVDQSNAGTTPLAIGDAINKVVAKMVNGISRENKLKPTHILCHISDESIVRAAINASFRNGQMTYATEGLEEAKMPLSTTTYGLQVITSAFVDATKLYVLEAGKHLISLEDTVDRGVILDSELIKLTDATNIYGKMRRGMANLFGSVGSGATEYGAVNKLTIA
jgi:hypothetical protein